MWTTLFAHAFLICAGDPSMDGSTRRPRSIGEMAEARQRLVTGEVEWGWMRRWNGKDSNPTEHYYTARFAGESYISIAHGDSQGVLYRDSFGRPSADYSFVGNPEMCLVRDSIVWMHIERDPHAELQSLERPRHFVWDIRALGLLAVAPRNGMDVRACIERFCLPQAPATMWTQSEINDGIQITAEFTDRRLQWTIDPRRDHHPVSMRVSDSKSKEVLAEARVTLRRFDRIWFPQLVEYWTYGQPEPSGVIRVIDAKFNRKDQPKELAPEDIGIEVGTSLLVDDDVRQSMGLGDQRQFFGWDGNNVISSSEMWARIKSGELIRGTQYVSDITRLRAGKPTLIAAENGLVKPSGRPVASAATPRPLHEWDRFVDQVAKRYCFNEIQKEAAQAVLRDLKRRVVADESDVAERFIQLESRIRSLMDSDQRRRYELDHLQPNNDMPAGFPAKRK